jgi:hypothetical protein
VHYGGKTQSQAVVSQSSFYSSNDPRLHFGLGAVATVDIDVHWPSGSKETYKGVATGQLVTFREGVGKVDNKGWAKSETKHSAPEGR